MFLPIILYPQSWTLFCSQWLPWCTLYPHQLDRLFSYSSGGHNVLLIVCVWLKHRENNLSDHIRAPTIWSYHLLLVIFHPSWYLTLLLIFAFSNLYKYFQLTFPTTLYIFPYSLNIMQECAKNISTIFLGIWTDQLNIEYWNRGGRYPIWFNSMFEFCQNMIH